MLDTFRKYQHNFVFSILIIAIIAVMALYGINQLNSEDSRGAGVAAWVNGEPISNREFMRVLEATIADYKAKLGDQLDERLLNQFQIPQNTLDEMVQYKLLAQQAAKLGFEVTDEELADYIRKAPAFQKNGKFDPELYRRVPNRGLEEKRIRESLLVRRMQTYLANRVAVVPDMAAREYALKDTKVNLSFARIDFKELAGKATPSAAEVESFAKSSGEAPLKAYYDGHLREFSKPAAVQLRQIRVGVPFQAAAEKKAEAKAKIESIAKETNKDNFGAMATKHSDDEFAKLGGLRGWVDRGTQDRSIEDSLSKLQPGQVSTPVETPFGFYLFQIAETRPEVVTPLSEVKMEVAKTLLVQKRSTDFIQKKRADWDAVLASGKGLEAELKAAHVDIKRTGLFAVGQGYIPQIGQSDEILDAVFKLTKKNPIAPKLYASGTDYYYIKLEAVEAPKATDRAAGIENARTSLGTQLQSTYLSKWIETLKEGSNIRTETKFEL